MTEVIVGIVLKCVELAVDKTTAFFTSEEDKTSTEKSKTIQENENNLIELAEELGIDINTGDVASTLHERLDDISDDLEEIVKKLNCDVSRVGMTVHGHLDRISDDLDEITKKLNIDTDELCYNINDRLNRIEEDLKAITA